MTVLSVRKDPEQLSMTITSEFNAPIERVWRMWDDPASSSAGGARRRTRRPSSSTTSPPVGR